MKKLQVAYNDALRIVLKIPRRSSASEMFVSNNVPTLMHVLRNCMYRFMCRLIGSKNIIIVSMADVLRATQGTHLASGNTGPKPVCFINDVSSDHS